MQETRSRRLGNPVALDVPNYPQNGWWVGGLSSEVGTKPLQRWMLGLPVLLYRGEDGTPVALDDRCPHRWAPLSNGYVAGNDIVCGYHGFRFAADGRCTAIPTQAAIPSVMQVRSYPVVERVPFVWVWTGDPARLPTELPPELPWTTDPARVTARGQMELACNYMALKENVLDLSHFAYAHAATLGVSDWTEPPRAERVGDTASYTQSFVGQPLPAHYGLPTGIGIERPADRDSWGTYVSPALQLAGVDITDPAPAAGDRDRFALRICHATTPIDPGRCHYWWFFSQDYGHAEGAASRLTGRIEAAFLEDKAILEATERMVRRDPRGGDYAVGTVSCDRAGMLARGLLQQSLEADRG